MLRLSLATLLPLALVLASACGNSPADAGLVDAGPADAGLADAGPADAGLVDAGPADAGPADAGLSDAGLADAGLADADVADADLADGGLNPQGPAPVELGLTTDLEAPAAYVFLAETGITNVTGSSITGGHLAVSPEALETITGFSSTTDPSNEFSTSDVVVAPGRIYASNHASPTPSNLTLAVGAMRAAYSDAASRTNPDGLNLSDGILDGITFAPGLYTWGSNVTIPGDITLSGGANDIWIFQITGTLEISADKSVLVTGGGQAKNIFWQVADQVTIEPGAHFEGIILGQTGITMQTNASMVGRALAQSLIAIDDNAVIAP